jgi:hypothetical protein
LPSDVFSVARGSSSFTRSKPAATANDGPVTLTASSASPFGDFARDIAMSNSLSIVAWIYSRTAQATTFDRVKPVVEKITAVSASGREEFRLHR